MEGILGQIRRAYPCHTSQVLSRPEDLSLPRSRHPAFFGSFDWHSCVHSHWALVRALRSGVLSGDDASELHDRAVEALEEDLAPLPLASEARCWESLPAHEELPYGLAWLLALDAELAAAGTGAGSVSAGAADRWRRALAPLAGLVRDRLLDWCSTLSLPVRSGIHTDSAWSLASLWDWSLTVGDGDAADQVKAAARRLFSSDVDAPCRYEPQGDTFSSPILNEAALMARVLPKDEYAGWLASFLPDASAPVAPVAREEDARLFPDVDASWDGASYHGVHLMALPFSRAAAARDASAPLPPGHPARAVLLGESRRWAAQGVAGMSMEGYLADHWLGSFLMMAVLPAVVWTPGAKGR